MENKTPLVLAKTYAAYKMWCDDENINYMTHAMWIQTLGNIWGLNPKEYKVVIVGTDYSLIEAYGLIELVSILYHLECNGFSWDDYTSKNSLANSILSCLRSVMIRAQLLKSNTITAG